MKNATLTLSLDAYSVIHSDAVVEAIKAGATSASDKADNSKVVMTFQSKAKRDAFATEIGHDVADNDPVDEHVSDVKNEPSADLD